MDTRMVSDDSSSDDDEEGLFDEYAEDEAQEPSPDLIDELERIFKKRLN